MNELELITLRKAELIGRNQIQDSIICFNDKKFKVKAEYVGISEDGNIDLSATGYRNSNFILFQNSIVPISVYIDGVLETGLSKFLGGLVYFLIPLTKEDIIEFPETRKDFEIIIKDRYESSGLYVAQIQINDIYNTFSRFDIENPIITNENIEEIEMVEFGVFNIWSRVSGVLEIVINVGGIIKTFDIEFTE